MPGHKDEPQHRIKGEITVALADLCNFEVYVLEDESTAAGVIAAAVTTARRKSAPTIVLVPPGFLTSRKKEISLRRALWSRTDAISGLLEQVGPEDALIATTGHIGREVYGQLQSRGHTDQSFLCVGAMGHASQIAAGLALAQPNRRVWCFDGDGAFLMHLGGAALIGALRLPNLIHLVFNNGVHGSVGGTATCAPQTDLKNLAAALGYRSALQISNGAELSTTKWVSTTGTPSFVEVRISADQGGQLGRPPEPLQSLSLAFQRFCLGVEEMAGSERLRTSQN
ncbi:thiamine pyrophosphate-dependent enzyme [Phyllobacterium sp. 22552]|uniref:thiamine pyrophosphate-dependent enzyme n=1 Tax=Phyllobacterium sp. 22552 TaxID=3453941 RepID=UPI003F8514F1